MIVFLPFFFFPLPLLISIENTPHPWDGMTSQVVLWYACVFCMLLLLFCYSYGLNQDMWNVRDKPWKGLWGLGVDRGLWCWYMRMSVCGCGLSLFISWHYFAEAGSGSQVWAGEKRMYVIFFYIFLLALCSFLWCRVTSGMDEGEQVWTCICIYVHIYVYMYIQSMCVDVSFFVCFLVLHWNAGNISQVWKNIIIIHPWV